MTMLEFAQVFAVLASTLFAGAALYVTLVEHPARMACGTELAATEFGPPATSPPRSCRWRHEFRFHSTDELLKFLSDCIEFAERRWAERRGAGGTFEMQSAPYAVLRFAPFELDIPPRELKRGSSCTRLQEQPFEILQALLDRRGGVVTRDERVTSLWPAGTFVDFEHRLNAAVKRLHAALEDNAQHPQYIESIRRRGSGS
jgi:Transcriptional regulatory protein, C terminal